MSEPLATSADLVALDPVEAAGEAIRDYCEWHISPVVQTILKCRRFPACLPTRKLVSIDDVTFADGVTTIDLSKIDWYENGEVYLPAPDCEGVSYTDKPVTITFTHGFQTTPQGIVSVIGSLTRRAALDAARGLAAGPFSVSPSGSISADFNTYEEKILEKYRVVPFA